MPLSARYNWTMFSHQSYESGWANIRPEVLWKGLQIPSPHYRWLSAASSNIQGPGTAFLSSHKDVAAICYTNWIQDDLSVEYTQGKWSRTHLVGLAVPKPLLRQERSLFTPCFVSGLGILSGWLKLMWEWPPRKVMTGVPQDDWWEPRCFTQQHCHNALVSHCKHFSDPCKSVSFSFSYTRYGSVAQVAAVLASPWTVAHRKNNLLPSRE